MVNNFKQYRNKETGEIEWLRVEWINLGNGKHKLWMRDAKGNTFSRLFNSDDQLDNFIEQQYQLIENENDK